MAEVKGTWDYSGDPKFRILSLGAGVQSSTMALMADEGAFGPSLTVLSLQIQVGNPKK